MFSDTIFDAMQDIIDNLDPDTAFKEVYPKEQVIKLLAQMQFLIALSDARLPDNSLTKTEENLYKESEVWARKMYDKKMSK